MLKRNFHYWEISLTHPEPLIDHFYFHGPEQLVLDDESVIINVHLIRDIVRTYKLCVDHGIELPPELLTSLRRSIFTKGGSYSEFVAFFKTLDFSLSAAKELSEEEINEFLKQALELYVEHREREYERRKLEYSDITIQALKDSGAARQTGGLANIKLEKLIRKIPW